MNRRRQQRSARVYHQLVATRKFPAKVLAFITGIIAIVLVLISSVSPDWSMAKGWRQGLFAHCIDKNAPIPLPFFVTDPPGCHPIVSHGYIRASAGLCILSFLTVVTGAALTGRGLGIGDTEKRLRCYQAALCVMIFSLTSMVISLLVYPLGLLGKLSEGNRTSWTVSWAYGLGWGAVTFLVTSVFFLVLDERPRVIYRKSPKRQRTDNEPCSAHVTIWTV